MSPTPVEDLLRAHAPRVLGVLVRRYGQFDACEDAVQEALLAASRQWPVDGVPNSPRSWLVSVATRRLTDQWRSEDARRRREVAAHTREPGDVTASPAADADAADSDDTLTLLFLCCHPDLSPLSQVALTLRAVGGLTTAEIAAAFLVPEPTMAQRVSRAKQGLRAVSLAPPDGMEFHSRLGAVLQVLYLIFNEGYAASSGESLQRADLTAEAIRLTRTVHTLLPDDGEVAGLLALMLLTDARRPARARSDGTLIPLGEQDRSRWNRAAIEEGVALVTSALAEHPIGPYQVQAAIAAVHDEAATAEATDWPQIQLLYRILDDVAPNPMVTLNLAIATAMVEGSRAGLDLLTTLDADRRLTHHHRLDAVRAHLLEMTGATAAARTHYLAAARRTASIPEQRYLESKAARLQ